MADSSKFDEFWSAYPLKVSKGVARKAWIKNKCDDHFEEIMMAVPNYIAYVNSKDWLNFAHPSTWINGERWCDEYPQIQAISNGTNDFLQRRAGMRLVANG